MCCVLSKHTHRVEISAIGLAGQTLQVVSEDFSWGAPICNEPLRQEGEVFVGDVRLDPDDMTLIRIKGVGEDERERIRSARQAAGVHQEDDDYSSSTVFLLVPGWATSSEGMPYPYSIAPQPQAQVA